MTIRNDAAKGLEEWHGSQSSHEYAMEQGRELKITDHAAFFEQGFDYIAEIVHDMCVANGFWDAAWKTAYMEARANGESHLGAIQYARHNYRHCRNVGEMLALIHTEVSEALEAHRKDAADDKLPLRKGLEVELADAIIRIMDLDCGLRLDIAGAVNDKIAFNASRPFKHGKKY